jgi:hypothetical protein
VADLEFQDVSGRPPTLEEVQSAKRVVTKLLVVGILKLPPELAVELPNVRRCLELLEALMVHARNK